MIHQWKRALLEGASGVFERGGRKAPEVDEEQVKDLHAKIGELAVANDFLARKLKPWTTSSPLVVYLRGLVERAQIGELHLDRSFYGRLSGVGG